MLNQNTTQQSDSEQTAPKLAPPGAGIPLLNKLMLKLFVGPLIAAKADWKVSEQNFYKVNGRILKEIEGLTLEQLSTRVLVPPQRGLEDSSRYWSVAMTLEHLTIVNAAVSDGIIMLSRGQVPPGEASTAAVKPRGIAEAQVLVAEYKKSVSEDYKKFLNLIQNRDSQLTYKHPWFGAFSCRQWFWLLPIHSNIHLKQIREIKKRLPVI